METPRLVFPEDDLLESLTKIYFEQIHPILNILHFPSFQRSIADGLHLRDREFGAVVLMVCSLTSRHSDDPRVFIDGANSEQSCGWKWFQQVRPCRSPFWWGASLYQLQLIFLSAIYTSGVCIPEECTILAALGVRLAQIAGLNTRVRYYEMEPLTAELCRRVFWMLVATDLIMGVFNGRPSTIMLSDLGVDLPVGCDDEFWGLPKAVQPETPSGGAFVPVFLRLMMIFGRIQRAVYPINGQMCLNQDVLELDSALNNWVSEIPEHLKWDPHQQNQTFLDQSAALYSTYYHAQVLIHRHFIPAPGKEDSLPNMTQFPSLAICANAARSCGHVLDVHTRRGRGLLHFPSLLTALFDSAVVLLINVWAVTGGRKSRTLDDFSRATADAQNCMRVLRLYEHRWRVPETTPRSGRDCSGHR
ncbi:fungal-specific transcription factor domain-containing protein [Mycena galopus ATCC 62051]|nr:fungal-specific transcription factor domain-containing protein [Mycena galopus ATCC 62051]